MGIVYIVLIGARAFFHRLFLEHAVDLGAEVLFGARVASFHDEAESRPFVVTEHGDMFQRVAIICFDAINSRAREYMLDGRAAPVPPG